MIAYARELGADLLIVHEHWLDAEQKRLLFEQNLPSVQHFTHDGGADLVFTLRDRDDV